VVVTLLLLLAQAPPPEGEDALRARLRLLVERLGDDDFETRGAAEKELLTFPVRFSAEIAALTRASPDAEVRLRAGRVVVPEPWPKLLPGTLAQARAAVEALLEPEPLLRHGAIQRTLAELARQPPAGAPALFAALLERPEPGAREFALAALARFPLDDPAPLLPHLTDPATAAQAIQALLASRDTIKLEEAILQVLPRDPPGHAQLVEVLVLAGSDRAVPVVRAYFERHTAPPAAKERALLALRDPAWARAQLAEARKDATRFVRTPLLQLATAAGASFRDDLHAWLDEAAPNPAVLKQLLPLLGVAGGAEDEALLVRKLGDPALAEAAAEALDMIGNPAHAPELVRAWKAARVPARMDRFVLSLTPRAAEEAVVEILSQPARSLMRFEAALALAERAPGPRVREALFRGLLEGGQDWWAFRAEAARVLAARPAPEDAAWIAQLSGDSDPSVRACGLLLAVRAGDAAAGRELAALLAARARVQLPHRTAPHWGATLHLLEWGAPAGGAWTRAVADEWSRQKAWTDGALFLAARESREAQEFLRAGLGTFNEWTRLRAERSLAAAGDAAALDRLFARLRGGAGTPEDERAFLAAAGRERRAAALQAARETHARGRGPLLRLAALMALPEGVPLYREVLRHELTTGRWEVQDEPGPAACARALAALKAREALPDLRRLLRARHASTRAAAALALAELGDREGAPLLGGLLDDAYEVPPEPGEPAPVRRVWHAAMEALEKLTAERPPGGSVAERRGFWREWVARNRRGGK
jgi:HEAT repeat protein